jgi:hypothetical protein
MATKELRTPIALGMLCCVGFPSPAQPMPAVPARVPPLSDYPGFDRNPPVRLPDRQLTGAAS